MSVLIHLVSSLEVGGKERVALQLAERARRAGWDARLVLFDAPFRDAERDLSPGSIPVEFVPRRAGFDVGFVRRLRRLLIADRVDLIHAHNDTAIFYAGCAAASIGSRRPALIGTYHTRPTGVSRAGRFCTRLASRRAHRIDAVSEELAPALVRDGFAAHCGSVRLGVDLDVYGPSGTDGGWRARLGLGAEALLVVHVARFDPIKRHVDLVEAWNSVERELPRSRLLLVGDGPLRESIRASVAGRSTIVLEPRVHDIAPLMRAADLVVLCSDHEATPRVLLEAMACARAIVATRVGGIPKLLDDGGQACGELVSPRDPVALASAIVELGVRADRRAELGRRARLRAGEYSADAEWSAFESIYRSALSASSA